MGGGHGLEDIVGYAAPFRHVVEYTFPRGEPGCFAFGI